MSDANRLPKSYDDDISREPDIVDAEVIEEHGYINPLLCKCSDRFPNYQSLRIHLAHHGITDPDKPSESTEVVLFTDDELPVDTRSEWSKTEDRKRGIHSTYDAPVTREEFNRVSALVAEHRNKIARLEEFMARMVQQTWGGG